MEEKVCYVCKKEIIEGEGYYVNNEYDIDKGPICVSCMEDIKRKRGKGPDLRNIKKE